VSPLVFALLFGLVCVAAFLTGLRFNRMTQPPRGATVEQVRRFGRLMMMASVAMFLFLVAVIVHGDLGVIRALTFRSVAKGTGAVVLGLIVLDLVATLAMLAVGSEFLKR
jgi:hypothetical protein